MLILSHLEIVPDQTDFKAKFNYKLTEWEDFHKALEAGLSVLPEL